MPARLQPVVPPGPRPAAVAGTVAVAGAAQATVVRPFRAPLSTYGAGHRGLDLGVADGTPVLAVEDGVVTHAGLVPGGAPSRWRTGAG